MHSDKLQETTAILRDLGVQVRTADDLRTVLKELRSIDTPEAARLRMALIVVAVVAGIAFSAAAFVSCLILTGDWPAAAGRDAPGYRLGGLGIVWGVVGVVMLATVAALFGNAPPNAPPRGAAHGSTAQADPIPSNAP